MDAYCPELAPPEVNDPDAGPLLIVNTWSELIGEQGIDPDDVISDGTWQVGVDVQPGTYRNSGGSKGCYWERLSGFSGASSDRLANGLSANQQIVTIEPSDAGFTSEDCGVWFRVDE